MDESKDFALGGEIPALQAAIQQLSSQQVPINLDLIFDTKKLDTALDAMLQRLTTNLNARLQLMAQQFEQDAQRLATQQPQYPLNKAGRPYDPTNGRLVPLAAATGGSVSPLPPKLDIKVEVPGFDKLLQQMQAQSQLLGVIKESLGKGRGGVDAVGSVPATAPAGGGRPPTPPPAAAAGNDDEIQQLREAVKQGEQSVKLLTKSAEALGKALATGDTEKIATRVQALSTKFPAIPSLTEAEGRTEAGVTQAALLRQKILDAAITAAESTTVETRKQLDAATRQLQQAVQQQATTTKQQVTNDQRVQTTLQRVQTLVDRARTQAEDGSEVGLTRAMETLTRAVGLARGPRVADGLRSLNDNLVSDTQRAYRANGVVAVDKESPDVDAVVTTLKRRIDALISDLAKITQQDVAEARQVRDEVRRERQAGLQQNQTRTSSPSGVSETTVRTLETAGRELRTAATDIRDSVRTPAGDFDWAALFRNLTQFSSGIAGVVDTLRTVTAGLSVPRTEQEWRNLNEAQRTAPFQPNAARANSTNTPIIPLALRGDALADLRAVGTAAIRDPELRRGIATRKISLSDAIDVYRNRAKAGETQVVATPALNSVLDLGEQLADPDSQALYNASYAKLVRQAERETRDEARKLERSEASRKRREDRKGKLTERFEEDAPELLLAVRNATPGKLPFPEGGLTIPIASGTDDIEDVQLTFGSNLRQSLLQRTAAGYAKRLSRLFQNEDGTLNVPRSVTLADVTGSITPLGEPNTPTTPEVRQLVAGLFPQAFEGQKDLRGFLRAPNDVARDRIGRIAEQYQDQPLDLTGAIKRIGYRASLGQPGSEQALGRVIDLVTAQDFDRFLPPEVKGPAAPEFSLPFGQTREDATEARRALSSLLKAQRSVTRLTAQVPNARGEQQVKLAARLENAKLALSAEFEGLGTLGGLIPKADSLETQDFEALDSVLTQLRQYLKPQQSATTIARVSTSLRRKLAETQAALEQIRGRSQLAPAIGQRENSTALSEAEVQRGFEEDYFAAQARQGITGPLDLRANLRLQTSATQRLAELRARLVDSETGTVRTTVFDDQGNAVARGAFDEVDDQPLREFIAQSKPLRDLQKSLRLANNRATRTPAQIAADAPRTRFESDQLRYRERYEAGTLEPRELAYLENRYGKAMPLASGQELEAAARAEAERIFAPGSFGDAFIFGDAGFGSLRSRKDRYYATQARTETVGPLDLRALSEADAESLTPDPLRDNAATMRQVADEVAKKVKAASAYLRLSRRARTVSSPFTPSSDRSIRQILNPDLATDRERGNAERYGTYQAYSDQELTELATRKRTLDLLVSEARATQYTKPQLQQMVQSSDALGQALLDRGEYVPEGGKLRQFARLMGREEPEAVAQELAAMAQFSQEPFVNPRSSRGSISPRSISDRIARLMNPPSRDVPPVLPPSVTPVAAIEEQIAALKDMGVSGLAAANAGRGAGGAPPPPPTPPAGGPPSDPPDPPNGDEWARFAKAMRELSTLTPVLRDMSAAIGAFTKVFANPAAQAAFQSNARKDYAITLTDLNIKLDQARKSTAADNIRLRTDEKLRLRDATRDPLVDIPSLGQSNLASGLPQPVIVQEVRGLLNGFRDAALGSNTTRNLLESGLAGPNKRRNLQKSLREAYFRQEGAAGGLVELLESGAGAEGNPQVQKALQDLLGPAQQLRGANAQIRPLMKLSIDSREAEAALKGLQERGAPAERIEKAQERVNTASRNAAAAGFKNMSQLDDAILKTQALREDAFNKIASGFRRVEQAAKEAGQGGGLDGFNKKLGALAQYTGAGFLVYGAFQQIRQSLSDVIQLESEIARVQGVLGEVGESSRLGIQNTVLRSARDFGVTTGEALQQYKLFAQAGVGDRSGASVERFTRAALLGSQAAGLEPQQATELLLAVDNQSRQRVGPFDILDRISEVERKNAVTAQDLSLGIQRVGAIASQFQQQPIGGVDQFDLINGLQTSIVENTRVGGNQSATALRFILARLGSPRVANQLQDEFGVNLGGRTPDEFRPLQDILSDIATTYQRLKAEGAASGDTQGVKAQQLLVAFAGARQLGAATAIFDNWNRVMEVANQSANAFGDSARRLAIQQETMAFQLKQIGVQWLTFTNNLVKESGLLDLAKGATRALGGLDTSGAAGSGTLAVTAGGLFATQALATRAAGALTAAGRFAPLAAGLGAIGGSTALGAGAVALTGAAALSAGKQLVDAIPFRALLGDKLGLIDSRATVAAQAQRDNFNQLDQVQAFDQVATKAGASRESLIAQLLGAQANAADGVFAQFGTTPSLAAFEQLSDKQKGTVRDSFTARFTTQLAPLADALELPKDPAQRTDALLRLTNDARRINTGFGTAVAESIRPEGEQLIGKVLGALNNFGSKNVDLSGTAGIKDDGFLFGLQADLRSTDLLSSGFSQRFEKFRTLNDQLNALYDQLFKPSDNVRVQGAIERARKAVSFDITDMRYQPAIQTALTQQGLTPAEQREAQERELGQRVLRERARTYLADRLDLDAQQEALALNSDPRQQNTTRGQQFIKTVFQEELAGIMQRLAKATTGEESTRLTKRAEDINKILQDPRALASVAANISKTDDEKASRGLVRDQLVETIASFAAASAEVARFGQLMGNANLAFDSLAEYGNVVRNTLRSLGGLEGNLLKQLALTESQIAQVESFGIKKDGTVGLVEVGENEYLPVNTPISALRDAVRTEAGIEQVQRIEDRANTLRKLIGDVQGNPNLAAQFTDSTRKRIEELVSRNGDALTLGDLNSFEQVLVRILRDVETGLTRREQQLALPGQRAQLQQLQNGFDGTAAQNAFARQTRLLDAQGRTTAQLAVTLQNLQQQTTQRLAGATNTRDAASEQARLLRAQGRSSDIQLNASLRSANIDFSFAQLQALGEQLQNATQSVNDERLRQQLGREAITTRLTGAAGQGLTDTLANPGLFSAPSIGTALLQPLAAAMQTTIAEAFTQNLLGPEGILGQQLRGLFDNEQLFQTRDLITDGHIKGAQAVADQIRNAFNAAAEQLRRALQLNPMLLGGGVSASATPSATPAARRASAAAVATVTTGQPLKSSRQSYFERAGIDPQTPVSDPSLLDPDFRKRLDGLMKESAEMGFPLTINETLRSTAREAKLRLNPNLVTAKGTSKHEVGRAADLSGSPGALTYAATLAKKYGLQTLSGKDYLRDPNHFQMPGALLGGPEIATPTIAAQVEQSGASRVGPISATGPRPAFPGVVSTAFEQSAVFTPRPTMARSEMFELLDEEQRLKAQQKDARFKQGFYQLGMQGATLLGTFAGSRVAVGSGRNPAGAQIGSTFGSTAGQLLGQKAVESGFAGAGSAIGTVVAPVIGTVIGGLVGGLIGNLVAGKGPKNEPEASPLQRIERNTRETVTAIENQSRLLELQDRFINVPAGFTVPRYRPQDTGGGGNTTTYQAGAITITVQGGNDPQATADAVYRRLQHEMTTQIPMAGLRG